MVASARVASSIPSVAVAQHGSDSIGKSAEIKQFPKPKLPHIEDYAAACADLIWRTFHAPSRWGVCLRAETETGLASTDTFERMLARQTKKIDGHLMHCILHFAHARGVAIPAALAVRIGGAA